MNIIVNGIEKNFSSNLTIETLLINLGHNNKKVAVEVNEEIITRSQIKNKLIVDGDRIEIIKAVGGG